MLGKVSSGHGEESPREEGWIDGLLHNLLLQSLERPFPFSVDGGHMDGEDTHKRVRAVLDAGGLALVGPGHTLGDAEAAHRFLHLEHSNRDVGDAAQQLRMFHLGAELPPVGGDELDHWRCNELLERPAAFVPLASRKRSVSVAGEVRTRHIG